LAANDSTDKTEEETLDVTLSGRIVAWAFFVVDVSSRALKLLALKERGR
jgi:hypothetical protein